MFLSLKKNKKKKKSQNKDGQYFENIPNSNIWEQD
jgi:hypothetical protein